MILAGTCVSRQVKTGLGQSLCFQNLRTDRVTADIVQIYYQRDLGAMLGPNNQPDMNRFTWPVDSALSKRERFYRVRGRRDLAVDLERRKINQVIVAFVRHERKIIS